MKNLFIALLAILCIMMKNTEVLAQTVSEQTQELSKAAAKGYFYEAEINPDNGNIEITYQMKGSKKDDALHFETYIFGDDLHFIKSDEIKPTEQNDKPDYTQEVVNAQLGNGRNLSIMSLKLRVVKSTLNFKWNKRKQKYYYTVENEEQVKLANEDDHSYLGYSAYSNYKTGEMMLLGMSLKDGKRRQFSLLSVKPDLTVKDIPLTIKDGMQSLAYSCLVPTKRATVDDNISDLNDADMIFVFAPKYDKNAKVDFKKYTYMRIDKSGNVKEQFDIDMPSQNCAIIGHHQTADGAVYLVSNYSSSKKSEPFEKRYGECVYISNPAMTSGAANVRMEKYEQKLIGEKKDKLAIIKIADGEVVSIVNNDIDEIAELAKRPASQKKTKAWDGGMFMIDQFNDLPDGGFLISGQKITYTKPSGADSKMRAYNDLVCLQTDNSGKVTAQYCISPKTIKDKDNTLFPIYQNLHISDDGSTAYLQLLENKSSKHKDFAAAMGGIGGYGGNISWASNYYPSVVRLDLNSHSITDYSIPGDREYELWDSCPFLMDKDNNAFIYVGSNGKKLWLGKYSMK